jgi:hypothetical protein
MTIRIMIGTSSTYLLLQGPGLFYQNQPLSVVAAHQQYWSLGGFALCVVLFSAYMWFQYQVAKSDAAGSALSDLKDAYTQECIKNGIITLFGAMQAELQAEAGLPTEETCLAHNDKKLARLEVGLCAGL